MPSTASEKPPLRVGLVGFGYAGSVFHAPLIRATAGLELLAVASRDTAKVRGVLGPQVLVCRPPCGDRQ